MIKFDRVSKRYPNGKDALRRINFELPAGQLTFLTGHSGAGKSTLLKLIMMIERPTQGQVFVEGQNLNGFSTRQVPFLRRKIGMVHQNHQLLFDRSVFDNVALPLVIAGFARADIGKRVRAALDKVGLLSKEKGNLDPALSAEIMDLFHDFARVGVAVLIATHDLSLIARHRHRLLTLREGRLIHDGEDDDHGA
jgi:cell division transport system ATP-binding protein